MNERDYLNLGTLMPFDREQSKRVLANLASRGVFIGTSSWKYEGWFGRLYTPGRYEYRGKVAKTRFERGCLEEYAEIFKTVCVDAASHTFPRREYPEGLSDQVAIDAIAEGHRAVAKPSAFAKLRLGTWNCAICDTLRPWPKS